MLHDILKELGVPAEQIEYAYRGEPGPNGLQGHIIIHLRVPASETLPELHTFNELKVKTSVEACVQSVSRLALRRVMRDAHEHLKNGPYRTVCFPKPWTSPRAPGGR